jgi:two-component system response regulator NreC
MTNTIRVFMVDDHTLVRSGLRLLLEKEADIEVVGEADGAASAILQVSSLAPDVILMDISLPDFDGVQAARVIFSECPAVRVIALTMHSEDAYLMQFLEAGGMGYVRKSAADRDLIRAIHTVMRGEIFLQPEGVQFMARHHHAPKTQTHPLDPTVLSERERQVIELVAKGFTCREIAETLSLSPRTVETYRERIMEKLHLTHRSELVEYALRHQLLKA